MILGTRTRALRPSSLKCGARVCTTTSRSLVDLAAARTRWNGRLVLSEEVEEALETGRPVAALESTIITHGMPYPTNLTTAQSLETILQQEQCRPATIALIDGKVHVGLSKSQLERLANQNEEKKHKVSRRDLAPVLATGEIGGTTVAGTMFIARSVGIDVFVTGGIGGVHRGAESSMDISADLIELGRTPMAVICAGAKSILDIPRTLEVLETQGVCVATYGNRPDFPAFYTPSSGMKESFQAPCLSLDANVPQSPWSVRNPLEAANLIDAGLSLPEPLSTLLAVPIPSEYNAEGHKVQEAVEQAVRESIEQGVDKRGKEVTPWLLKRVGELTKGSALHLNVKLIENNAAIGGRIARELAILRNQNRSHASSAAYPFPPSKSKSVPAITGSLSRSQSTPPGEFLPKPSVLVFGSAAIDITSSTPLDLSPRSTTPGNVYLTPGGVGRNIAESAQNHLQPNTVKLVSVIGTTSANGKGTVQSAEDAFAKVLRDEMIQAQMRTDGLIRRKGGNTSVCSLMLEKDGDLVAGVADMDIVESISPEEVAKAISENKAKLVVFDCNLLPTAISEILKCSAVDRIPTFCDPTSIPKLPRLVEALMPLLPSDIPSPRPLTHISPNMVELDLLHSRLSTGISSHQEELIWTYINSLNLLADWRAKIEAFGNRPDMEWVVREGVIQKAVACLPWVENLWIKAGMRGLLHIRITNPQAPPPNSLIQQLGGIHQGKVLAVTHYPAVEVSISEIVSTTGAGDTLVGGLVAGLISGGKEEVWVSRALEAAARTVKSRRAVG